jgi:peroxiredoxin
MARTESLSRTDFIPYLSLATAPDGHPVELHASGREATVLVFIHSNQCAECKRYLTDLAALANDFAWWGGRVVVRVPGSLDQATALQRELGLPFIVTSDPDERASLIGDDAGVVIADRYGQVYDVNAAGPQHGFMTPAEVDEWLKFIGTQCPECGVPDEPGHGEWDE